MSRIETLARQIAESFPAGDYQTLIQELRSAIKDADNPKANQYRAMAKEKWESEGECEIDDNAIVSESEDGGAYVQAWVWVDNE